MSFTIAQVSDTHLGARTALFRANFDRITAALDEARPDLIIASGDVSLDGSDRDADLVLAAERFASLPAPVYAIPGNHDVGDHPELAPLQAVNTDRLDRFRRHMGPDRWVFDHENWRLIGLNSQIMGAHAEESLQAAMIADAVATLGDRRIAVFIHKPVFATDPDETLFDYWSVPPHARAALLPLMAHPQLRLVASGHLHLHRQVMRGPTLFAWAPSVAFVVSTDEQHGLPGARPTGALLHRFDDDTVDTTLIEPPGMDRQYIHEIRDQTYPRT